MGWFPIHERGHSPQPKQAELLDDVLDSEGHAQIAAQSHMRGAIGCGYAKFSWSNKHEDEVDNRSQSSQAFSLIVESDLAFQVGALNLVIGAQTIDINLLEKLILCAGPTGSGKTSLLLALLGEMRFHPRDDRAWCGLPREGGIAYATQESWIENRTIRVSFHCDNTLLRQLI